MPSNKPRLMTYTDEEIIKKFDKISQSENRSMSKELEYIVKKYIERYEQKNGKIEV